MNPAVDNVTHTKTAIAAFVTFLAALLNLINVPVFGLEDTQILEIVTLVGGLVTTVFFRQGVLKTEKKVDAALGISSTVQE